MASSTDQSANRLQNLESKIVRMNPIHTFYI